MLLQLVVRLQSLSFDCLSPSSLHLVLLLSPSLLSPLYYFGLCSCLLPFLFCCFLLSLLLLFHLFCSVALDASSLPSLSRLLLSSALSLLLSALLCLSVYFLLLCLSVYFLLLRLSFY